MTKDNRNSKREKFVQPKKSKGLMIVGISAVILVLGLISYNLLAPAKGTNGTNKVGGDWSLGSSISYGPSPVEQTVVKNVVENGQVKISKDDVKNNKIVYTEYKKGNSVVPLTAFANTKGQVVVAFSMCEPCKGTRFHVEGDELVCNTCGSRWKLSKMAPVSGSPACLKYPPEEMKYVQDGNFITMDESKVSVWQPRV